VSAPLLKTKLYAPPIRSELVGRPRLTERLDEGLRRGCRLTLLSAPAGYGKTTLLSEWIAQPRLVSRVAWVSLDESDNDPTRFWAYVATALQTVEEGIEQIDQTPIQPPESLSIESALIGLLNQIATVEDPIVLVLDDYHLIGTAAIHEAISFALDNLPPQMHLVIATRVDPPLPIPRLRGRGQLTEVYEADLRFTSQEAAEFLNRVMGPDLSEDDVTALERRTEGWIAGLQMAAVSMRGRDDVSGFVRAFTGSHRYVLDYLGGEVLQRQPEPVRDFLLKTAILDRLTAPLCDTVMAEESPQEEEPGSQAMLEHLEKNNLFVVPLDDERRWYRYHRLFSDLLRQRLQREKADLVPELHRRASHWYEEQGLTAEAVSHALTSRDYGRSADLIEQAGWSSFTRGEMATILTWIAALPDAVVRSRPQLSVLRAWALAKSGQLDGAELCLREIDSDHHQGEVTAVRAYVAGVRGELPRAVELAHQALERLPEENLLLRAIVAQNLGVAYHWSGNSAAAVRSLSEAVTLSRRASQPFQALTGLAILGRAYEMEGSLRQAMTVYREALDIASEPGSRPVPFASMAYVGRAGVLYERNELEDARRCAVEGIRLSELGGFVAYQVFGRALLARIYEAEGDRQRAENVLDEAERLRKGRDYTLVWALVSELRVRLWLAQGNVAAASQWAQERSLNPGDALDSGREIEQMAVARVLIAQDEPADALELLGWLLEAAEAAGRGASVINVLILEALALQTLALEAQGHSDRAMSPLARALSLSEPEGYVRSFVDEGEPMARLLRQALSRGIRPSYVARLLAAFDEEVEPTAPGMESLVEPLTERELEVLRLIVAGLSNPEIADELFIAVSTVKSHVNHIYGKLAVENRVQAANRAQALGLV